MEAATNLESQGYAIPAGGLARLGVDAADALIPESLRPVSLPTADEAQQAVTQALTYQPESESGKEATAALSYPFEKLAEGGQYLGDKTLEATGSPALAAAAYTATQLVPFAVAHKIGEGILAAPEAIRASSEARINAADAGKPVWDGTKDALDAIQSTMEQKAADPTAIDFNKLREQEQPAPLEAAAAPPEAPLTDHEQAAQNAWTGFAPATDEDIHNAAQQTVPGFNGTQEPLSAKLVTDKNVDIELKRKFQGSYDVLDGDGKQIGNILYHPTPMGGWKVAGVEVAPEMQRKGVASAVYDFLEKNVTGQPFENSGGRSEAGTAFRAARTERAVEAPTERSTVLDEGTQPKAEETAPSASGAATAGTHPLFDDIVPRKEEPLDVAASSPSTGAKVSLKDDPTVKRDDLGFYYRDGNLVGMPKETTRPRTMEELQPQLASPEATAAKQSIHDAINNTFNNAQKAWEFLAKGKDDVSVLARKVLSDGKDRSDIGVKAVSPEDLTKSTVGTEQLLGQNWNNESGAPLGLFTRRGPNGEQIYLRGAGFKGDGLNRPTLGHELLHSELLGKISELKKLHDQIREGSTDHLHPETGKALEAYRELDRTREALANHPDLVGNKGTPVFYKHAVSNVDELTSVAMTDPGFRRFLKDTKLGAVTAWSKVKEAWSNMLGLGRMGRNVIDHISNQVDTLLKYNPEAAAKKPVNELGWETAEPRASAPTRVSKADIDRQAEAARQNGASPEAVAKRVRDLYSEHGHEEGPAPTSTKNAVRDAERASEGRDPILKQASQSNPETFQKAQKTLAENPNRPKEIINRIAEKGVENISVEDEAVLLTHKVDVRNQRDSASKVLSDPHATEEAKSDARVTWSEKEAEIAALDQATTASGREWGRLGQFRQQLMRNDYSFESLERRTRSVLERPLTPKESAVVKEHADRIQAETDKQAATQGKLDAFEKSPYKQMTAELVKQLRGAANKGTFLETLKKNADESRAWLKKSMGQLNSGVDPAAFYHLARIGAYHIANGAVKFADWAAKMKSDLGEHFTHLEDAMPEVYKAAKAQHDFGQTGIKSRVRSELSPEEKYQQTRGKTIKKETEKVYAKIRAGDFERTQRIHRELNSANKQAAYDLYQAKNLFRRHQFALEMSKRSPLKKIFGTVSEFQNFARAVMTSVDLSATLRQGGFVVMGHPIMGAKALWASIKASRGEKYAHALQYEIEHRPNFFKYKQAGLDLTLSSGHVLDKVEEQFMSRWIEKMPSVLGGGLVRGSERAFKGFLNKLRADSFDAMVASLARNGEHPTHEEMKAAANYINIATGRGKIGHTNIAAAGLSKVLFAPRLVASRFNLLAGQPLYGGTRATRTLIAKEYARFLAGTGVVLGLGYLAHLATANPNDKSTFFEINPQSANFGKMKFGNSYVDILGGLGQTTTFLARELSGENKNQAGEVVPLRKDYKPLNLVRKKQDLGEPGYGKLTGAEVAGNFLRTKFAPIPGAAVDLLAGKNVIGQGITPEGEAANLVVPMSFSNIVPIMKEHGVAGGTALTLLDLLGMSVQQRTPYKH